jgi:hypothetical protein
LRRLAMDKTIDRDEVLAEEPVGFALEHPFLYGLTVLVLISSLIAGIYGMTKLGEWSDSEWQKIGVNFSQAMGR